MRDPSISSAPYEERAAGDGARGLTLRRDAAIVALQGEFDAASVSDLTVLLDRAHQADRPVTMVDMAEVTFIDSSIMRLLLDSHRRSEAEGRLLLISDLQGHPREMIRLAGLHLTLHLFDTPSE